MIAAKDRILKKSLIAWPFVFGLACLALSIHLDFEQLHNDFWDVYFIARHMVWANRQSWFNPQYPVGYSFFLKVIAGGGMPVVPAILANIFFGCGTLVSCVWFYRKFMSAGLALASLIVLSVFPLSFHYINVAGGDPGSVAFFTVGAFLILSRIGESSGTSNTRDFFFSGLLLGLAGLFRYHALVADGLFIFALFCVYPRRWKSLAVVSAGVCLAYSPQWAVNILTGHGLLKTQFGPMNVYYLMHGINWYRTTELTLPGSTLSIIAADPGLFLRNYFHSFLSFYPAYVPPLFAAVFEKDPRWKLAARAVAVWVIAYFILFSATTSGRQILLPMPLAFLAFGMSLRIVWTKLTEFPVLSNSRLRFSLFAIFILLLTTVYARRDFQVLSRRSLSRDVYVAIESRLKEGGCARANEVFTSDFDLYFRTMPHYFPYFNGGAPRWGTYLYNEEFPEFPVDTGKDFVEACRKRGVKYVVLESDSRLLSDTLGALYDGTLQIPGLEKDTVVRDHKLFKVI